MCQPYCNVIRKPVELPFGMVSEVSPGNGVLDGCAHWRHLENTVERLHVAAMSGSATRGGDAACSQMGILFFSVSFVIFLFLVSCGLC